MLEIVYVNLTDYEFDASPPNSLDILAHLNGFQIRCSAACLSTFFLRFPFFFFFFFFCF